MWERLGQSIIFADTNQMWSGILWFLIIGGLFYWMMRMGGCGAHGHGGHGGHGDHVDQDHPRRDQANASSPGDAERLPPAGERSHHH